MCINWAASYSRRLRGESQASPECLWITHFDPLGGLSRFVVEQSRVLHEKRDQRWKALAQRMCHRGGDRSHGRRGTFRLDDRSSPDIREQSGQTYHTLVLERRGWSREKFIREVRKSPPTDPKLKFALNDVLRTS